MRFKRGDPVTITNADGSTPSWVTRRTRGTVEEEMETATPGAWVYLVDLGPGLRSLTYGPENLRPIDAVSLLAELA